MPVRWRRLVLVAAIAAATGQWCCEAGLLIQCAAGFGDQLAAVEGSVQGKNRSASTIEK